MTRNFLAAVCLLALLGCSPQSTSNTTTTDSTGRGLADSFQRSRAVVINSAGVRHTFDIYLATTFEQRRRGFMFVRSLPQMTGMLFIYDGEEIQSMWMKNTYLSLDILYARADGTVIQVIHDTEPLSLRSLPSREPVKFALELNAGVARRLRIGPGSRLIWPVDQSTAAIDSAR